MTLRVLHYIGFIMKQAKWKKATEAKYYSNVLYMLWVLLLTTWSTVLVSHIRYERLRCVAYAQILCKWDDKSMC